MKYRGVTINKGLWQGKYGTLPEYKALGFSFSSLQDIQERIDIELDYHGIEIATSEQEQRIIDIVTGNHKK